MKFFVNIPCQYSTSVVVVAVAVAVAVAAVIGAGMVKHNAGNRDNSWRSEKIVTLKPTQIVLDSTIRNTNGIA